MFNIIKNNKFRKFLILLFATILKIGNAQPNTDWAGPNKSTCGELGVIIGDTLNTCLDCCYKWEPADGLSSTTINTPLAKPRHRTTYRVTVIAADFSWTATDNVTVDVAFGEIRFNPTSLEQGGEDDVLATLNRSNGNNIQWTLDNPLGCSISGNGTVATITPGSDFGTVTVKAANLDIPGCVTREDIDINEGAKDVWAIDKNHPNRIAKKGETLYLIGETTATIKAIPNEGGFQNGAPYWYQDSYGSQLMSDGISESDMSESPTITGRTSEYIAGPPPSSGPKVTVIRKLPQTTDYGSTIQTALAPVTSLIKNYFNYDGGSSSSNPCGSSTPFSADLNIGQLTYTSVEVEKYNSKDLGEKKTLSIGATVSLTGNLYHPVYTKNARIPGTDIFACTKLGINAQASASFSLSAIKDESLQNSDWMFDNPSVTLSFCLGGGIEGVLSAADYQLQLAAGFTACAKPTLFYDLQDNTLKFKITILPATTTVIARIVNISDPANVRDVFSLPSQSVQLMSPLETMPQVLYQF